jgi:hypothetical protein
MSYINHSNLNAFNHALSFTVNREVTRKVRLSLGMAASYSNIDQLLFTPTSFQRAAALPATLDDFANSLLATPFTSDQLAAMLTGLPVAESPARLLLFGDRTLSTSANTSLSYSATTRSQLTFQAGVVRSQPILNDGIEQTRLDRTLSYSSGGSASFSYSYSLSPRTQIGAAIAESRTFSPLQDAYSTSFTMFAGRKMSRRWFGQLMGGGGFMRPVRETVQLPRGPQYLAGGSIGFRAQSNTVLLAVNRTFGDNFGIGAASTVSASIAWVWNPMHRSWSVQTSASSQRFQGQGIRALNTWQGMFAVSKSLGQYLSSTIEYAYARYETGSAIQGVIAPHAVRASLVWTPFRTAEVRRGIQ